MNNITTQRIRELANDQGISLKFLCDKIGVKSRTYFQDIEKSKREIPADKLEIIASALNTTTDYLLGNTDDKNASVANDDPSENLNKLLEDATLEELLLWKSLIEKIIQNRK